MKDSQRKAIFAKINSPNSKIGKLALELLRKQPKEVQESVKKIIITNRKLSKHHRLDYNQNTGVLRIAKDKKFRRAFNEPAIKHEFAHAWFWNQIESKNPKITKYVTHVRNIKPPTINAEYYYGKLKKAKQDKKPVLLGNYIDELHSETAEYIALKKFGNAYIVTNPQEMRKAVKYYEQLHRK